MSKMFTRDIPKSIFLINAIILMFLSCWDDKTIGSDPNPTFTVTYSAGDSTSGKVPIDDNNYEALDTVIVLANTDSLVKEGYTFAGWNTASNGSGVTYVPGTTFIMGATSVILYAQWIAIKAYKVTYNSNGSDSGVVPIDSINYNTGDTITILGNPGMLTKMGATFHGWSLTIDGEIVNGNLLMDTNDVILYALWNNNPTYTVTYDGNGSTAGIVPSDTNKYEKGSTVDILGNTGLLVKTGFTFIGWSTLANGELVGSTFLIDTANVILFAQWSSNPTYTVTYVGNGSDGGTVPVDTKNYESGTTVTVIGNTGSLTKSGFTFIGWSTVTEGDLVGSTFSMETTNVILYAQWSTKPTYTVIYDGNGYDAGNVPVDTKNYESGATVTVLGNTGSLVKSGFTFIGWSTTIDGDLVSTTFLMEDENITLYAQWSAKPTYTVTYDGNGHIAGAVPEDNNKYEQSSVVTILGNSGNLEKTGYSFIGWSQSQDGSGDLYGEGGEPTMIMGNTDVKLWAQWEINTYTVTFEENGGSEVDSQHVTHNSFASDPEVPTKNGYTFEGWYTSQQFTTIFDFAGTAITSNRVLFAKWAINQYSLIYNSNGSTSGEAPISSDHDYNSNVTVLENCGSLKKFGYEFAGWSITNDGDSLITSFIMDTTDVILYAKWDVVLKVRNMTLIFAKDSSFSMGSTTGNSDEQPVHTVTFTYDFYMDTTEVTQGDYDVVMDSYAGYTSPSWNGTCGYGFNYPAYYINWDDAVLYCNARSKAEGRDTVYMYSSRSRSVDNRYTLDGFSMDLSRNGYRLPTEAEWEYACRAGTITDFYWDNSTVVTNDCAWYTINSDSKSHEVASKKSNGFGLYDMAGNVYEWCNDWYGSYTNNSQKDPTGAVAGTNRVLRSGSYMWSGEDELRSAYRLGMTPEYSTIGFRVVLPGE